MRLIDRLVVKEVFGPWLFGVGLFASLLMAATYLGRIAGFIVDGVPVGTVLQMVGLLMPAILAKTFTMAMLLATLLSFGRLSADSEIVAMRAGGAGIFRIVLPVMGFSLAIAGLTFAFNEAVVPEASKRSRLLTEEIARALRPNAALPVSRTEVQNYKLRAFINAENVNPASQVLQGVTVVAYDEQGQRSLIMLAKELEYKGPDDWRIRGGATLLPVEDGFTNVVTVEGELWPRSMPKLASTFREVASSGPPDFDSLTMAELRQTIERAKAKGTMTREQIANHEYGFWNKIAMPLAAFVFGTLGAVLGIRNHRTGTATGFAIAVAIIFGYVTLANFMNVWAMGGVIPPYAASFAPLALGLAVAAIIMWRRNA
jgi:lipopolysaccharide export system permease protein